MSLGQEVNGTILTPYHSSVTVPQHTILFHLPPLTLRQVLRVDVVDVVLSELSRVDRMSDRILSPSDRSQLLRSLLVAAIDQDPTRASSIGSH